MRTLRPCDFPWCVDKSAHRGRETRLHPAMNTPARIIGQPEKARFRFPHELLLHSAENARLAKVICRTRPNSPVALICAATGRCSW